MLKLGICQMFVEADKKRNIRKARGMIAEAANQGCKVVVLPEMFNCPYQNDLFIAFAESFPSGETLQMLSTAAAEEQILIVGGSIPECDGQTIYNTSFIFNESGSLVGRHRKVHLFDIDLKEGTVFKESDTLHAGDAMTLVTWNKVNIGVAICYDIRFPELARIMCDYGAHILIYPAAFGPETGPAHWQLLIQARALDNQLFVVGAAPALNAAASYQAYGHSMIADPWGHLLCQADEQEQLLIAEIDLSSIEKIRSQLPILRHTRKDIYDKYRK